MTFHLETAEDVLEFLMMIKGGDAGRGLDYGPQTGLVEAIRGDRESARKKASGRRLSPRRSGYGLRVPGRAAPKKKRKVSPYQKEFGRQLKKLKRKHPRTPVQKLMKRAHAATRKARRGK
jgi:hypothetical protein